MTEANAAKAVKEHANPARDYAFWRAHGGVGLV
jgi:hypothetical protein